MEFSEAGKRSSNDYWIKQVFRYQVKILNQYELAHFSDFVKNHFITIL